MFIHGGEHMRLQIHIELPIFDCQSIENYKQCDFKNDYGVES